MGECKLGYGAGCARTHNSTFSTGKVIVASGVWDRREASVVLLDDSDPLEGPVSRSVSFLLFRKVLKMCKSVSKIKKNNEETQY